MNAYVGYCEQGVAVVQNTIIQQSNETVMYYELLKLLLFL